MLSILFVCTGNICRSPFAERYTRLLAERGDIGPVSTHSAGIGALVGNPVDPPMATQLAGAGGSPEGFAARQISAELVTGSDLVIPMESYQREWILEEYPRAFRHTFTLGQLVRHLEEPEVAGLVGEELLAEMGRHRRRARSRDDVPDPYRRGDTAMADAARLIAQRLDVVLPRVAPPMRPDYCSPSVSR